MTTDTIEKNAGRRDLERAIGKLAERLPEPLTALARVTYNYRWAWMPNGARLFSEIDAAIWRHGEFNPRYVIEAAPPRHLHGASADCASIP